MSERVKHWSQGLAQGVAEIPVNDLMLVGAMLIVLLLLFGVAGTSDWMAMQAHLGT